MKTDEAEIKCLQPLGAPFITVSLGASEHLVQGLLPPHIPPSCCSRHTATERGQPQTSHYRSFPKQWAVYELYILVIVGYKLEKKIGSRSSSLYSIYNISIKHHWVSQHWTHCDYVLESIIMKTIPSYGGSHLGKPLIHWSSVSTRALFRW